MNSLVFVESSDGKIKKTSLECVRYAQALGGEVTVVGMGTLSSSALKHVGKYGAKKVLHIADARLDQGNIQAYSSVLEKVFLEVGANVLILANSPLGTPVAARVAARLKAGLATNVVGLPDVSKGFKVKQSIFTGKAFSWLELKSDRKVLVIKKNSIELTEGEGDVGVENFEVNLEEKDFRVKVLSTEKISGDVLLSEAEIVVSGGRGMKGPEHWGIIEELASALGAATGCSKPVSDMGWRPHHEHVGQTGIKVSPQLYIAIGISGAIQHLAGVNSSKVIVVINKDPEAPFFKAADYGVVGDAFEIVPKLTEAIKALK